MLIKGKMLMEFTYASGWDGVSMLQSRDKIKKLSSVRNMKKIGSYSAKTDAALGSNNQLVGETD